MDHSLSFCAVESQVKLVEASVGEELESIRGLKGHNSQADSSKYVDLSFFYLYDFYSVTGLVT